MQRETLLYIPVINTWKTIQQRLSCTVYYMYVLRLRLHGILEAHVETSSDQHYSVLREESPHTCNTVTLAI